MKILRKASHNITTLLKVVQEYLISCKILGLYLFGASTFPKKNFDANYQKLISAFENPDNCPQQDGGIIFEIIGIQCYGLVSMLMLVSEFNIRKGIFFQHFIPISSKNLAGLINEPSRQVSLHGAWSTVVALFCSYLLYLLNNLYVPFYVIPLPSLPSKLFGVCMFLSREIQKKSG